jgi:N6-adenosine-specific RNA methylase IME4
MEEWTAAILTLGRWTGWTMWWWADGWAFGEAHYGSRKAMVESPDWHGPAYASCRALAWVARRIKPLRRLNALPWDHYHQAARLVEMNNDGTIRDDSAAVQALAWAMRTGQPCTVQEMRVHVGAIKFGIPGPGMFTGDGPYRTVVVDPAWPMEKIERDVAPNQFGLDYPTMSVEELIDFWNRQVAPRLAPDAHIYLWTTQKWRWAAENLVFPAIGLDRSMVLFTWHKDGGFQPFGLPQFNSEFVLYGRKGSAEFIDLRDFNTCFNAPRRDHSRKPTEFYETVKRTCPPPRIDVFSREPHDGFDQFGNEIMKFTELAR